MECQPKEIAGVLNLGEPSEKAFLVRRVEQVEKSGEDWPPRGQGPRDVGVSTLPEGASQRQPEGLGAVIIWWN